MVRDGYVVAEINDVVRESVSDLASNRGGCWWLKVLHGKTKILNTTIEMVKRIWF